MQMRQYEIQKSYYDSQRSLYQQKMSPGMMTQGQSMASGGYMEHIHRHHGHGHGQSMASVTQGAGPTPMANVAANQAAGMLGPGRASSMITGGTAAGVGATQGVTNATMGATQGVTNTTMGMGQSMMGG